MDSELLQIYRRAVAPFDEDLERLRPPNADLIDVHTHLGVDEDGRHLSPDELIALMDDAGVRRSCVFPLHDPERHPAYSLPNDRVLEWAAASDGRFVPFCRLDPAETPLAEVERCLSNGARGIKLHPRAQGFALRGGEIESIFALAEQARVPLLIHAGRGLPAIGDSLSDLALRHPDLMLILAHAAIADQGTIAAALAQHPGVLYDTSVLSPLDIAALLARVPAERVVFGSDPPYGRPREMLYTALRVAAAVGLDDDVTRLLLGGTVAEAIDDGKLGPATPPRAEDQILLPGPLARILVYLAWAIPAIFAGHADRAIDALAVAMAVCRDPNLGRAGEAIEIVAPALEATRALVEADHNRLALDLGLRVMARVATEPAPDLERAGGQVAAAAQPS